MSVITGKTFGRGTAESAHHAGSMSVAIGDKVHYTGAFPFEGEHFTEARETWEFARAAATAIEGAKLRLAADENLSEKGRHAALQEFAKEHLATAAKRRRQTIQAGRERIAVKAKKILESSVAPPSDAADAIADMEMRSMFRNAQGDERTRLVNLAMSGQEPSLRNALLRQSPALTGLAESTYATLREQAIPAHEASQMTDLKEQAEALTAAETALNALDEIASSVAGVGEPLRLPEDDEGDDAA